MQVFTETQGIVMEFEGTNFLLTCTAVTVQDKLGDPVSASQVRIAAGWLARRCSTPTQHVNGPESA